MNYAHADEIAVLHDLEAQGPCTIDELLQRLPDLSWKRVYRGVARLSRSGQPTLRHPTTFRYGMSLNAHSAGGPTA